MDVPDIPRMLVNRNKIHTFVRTSNRTQITASTTLDQAGAYTVALTDFPSSSDFTNLFDEYRIVQLTFEFFPVATTSPTAPIYTAIDPDDGSTPGSADVLRQFDTCRIVPGNHYFERTFTPMVSGALYSGTFSSFGNVSPYKMWIDNASTSVQHYGIKYYWPANATEVGAAYVVQAKAVIQCRHPQ